MCCICRLQRRYCMALKKEFTCDGCQKLSVNSIPGWMELFQPEKSSGEVDLQIFKGKYFCTLTCLAKWAAAAAYEEEKIQEVKKSLPRPHGGFISREKGMEDMYF